MTRTKKKSSSPHFVSSGHRNTQRLKSLVLSTLQIVSKMFQLLFRVEKEEVLVLCVLLISKNNVFS